MQEVLDGTKVSENDVSKQPKVEIEGAFVMPGSLYTIMLVSSSAIGEGKERVHWIHVNYQGPQDIGSAGTSWHVFLLCKNAGTYCW